MPQPTAYTPATDFSDDEANAVGGRSTVRTAALDAEFSALNTTLDGVLASLSLNQRDDGEIRDGRVKLHTLASDVRALFVAGGMTASNLRGDWVTATAYVALDVVTQSANTYICATAHTSGTFATDLAADKWILLTLGSSVAASAVSFAPTGTIAATDVQAAIDEADTEGRALTAAVRTDLADVSTAAKGDALVGWGAIVSIVDGMLTRHATLAAAVSAVGSTRCTVVVRDDVTMAASASFPATCTVRIENGAQITTTGYTLTFGAKPQLPPGQCFAGTGSVVFSDGVEGPGFRPQWWGAKADSGTTNNYTAIMAAIAAAETRATAAGKATVWLEAGAGYYSISSPVVINAGGVTLAGGGQIYNPGGNCLELGDNVANRADIHVLGMNLQCSGAGSIAVRARKAPNFIVDRCTIVSYDASGDGIRATDSFCARVTNNTFGSIRGYGIHASSSANAMYIAGNRIDGLNTSSTCGIYIDGTGNAIVGNTIETWGTCINGKALKGGVIDGNYFEVYTTGILCDSSGAEGVNIAGNYFAATSSTVSIKLSAGLGYRIGPNSFVGTHSIGSPIELTTGVGDVDIDGNLIQHDDAFIVTWPINHLALRQHLTRDRSTDTTFGYLSAVTHTGATGETTLQTYTGVRQHWGTGTQVEVEAAGRITGTSGQKDVRLKLAGTTVATVTEAAGETADWIIRCVFDIASATVAQATVFAFQGPAVEIGDVVQGGGITIALTTTDPVITLTGQLGNSGDSILLTRWSVRVIN